MEDIRFKVYTFWEKDQSPEVKKFKMAITDITSFVCFRSKLEVIFPDLKLKKYSITWKDYEGDDITISSDSDIQTAIEEYSLPVFKLYVYCNGNDKKKPKTEFLAPASTSGNTAGNSSNWYLKCSNCNSAIKGFRYKCISCDDVDLCSKCEISQVHPDHCMIRVPETELIRNDIKCAIKKSRAFLKTVSNSAPSQGEKKAKRDRSREKQHRGDCDEKRYERNEHKHGSHRNVKHCYCRPKKSWLDTFNNYINEFANLAGDIDVNGNDRRVTEQTQPNSDDEVVTEDAPINSTVLKKVISNSCDVLNQVKAEMLKAGIATSSVMGASVNKVDKSTDDSNLSAKPSVSNKRDVSPDQAGDWTMINKDKDLSDDDEQKTIEADTTTHVGFNLAKEFRDHVTTKSVEKVYPPLNINTAVTNPQDGLKNQSSTKSINNGGKQETASDGKGQNTNSQEPTAPVGDPQFQNVIQSLLAMGFMGAQQLADLVEAYNGDISAVIDNLTQRQP